MKYNEVKFIEISKIEELKIKRYDDEKIISNVTHTLFTPTQIKEIEYNGNIYKRDKEEVNIDWLGDNIIHIDYFCDTYLYQNEKIMMVIFKNIKGEIEYGFSDHND